MKKPQFPHCNTLYTIGWILTIPILIEISTCCTLFSIWIAWLLLFIVTIISGIRVFQGFRQKCYKFSWGLLAQVALGFVILAFFQLSFNHTIQTPMSHPVTGDVVEVSEPIILPHDSTPHNIEVKPVDTIKDNKSVKDNHKVHSARIRKSVR